MPSQRKEQHLASGNNGHYTRRIHKHVFAPIESRVDFLTALQGIICDVPGSAPSPVRRLTTRWLHLDASIQVRRRDPIPTPQSLDDPSMKDNQPAHCLPTQSTPWIYESIHLQARMDYSDKSAGWTVASELRGTSRGFDCRPGATPTARHTLLLFPETEFNYSKTIYGIVIRNGMIQGGKDWPCVSVTTRRN